ncbi:hypothetical protein MMC13_001346 [Lambiella insularis]|nr:hypothetical protein [Lambiella insularis]
MLAGNLITVHDSGYPPIGNRETAPETTTAFPLHEACLNIVYALLARRRNQSCDGDCPSTLSAFHERLLNRRVTQSIPYNGQSSLQWEHDGYGASSMWQDGHWESAPGWEFLCADPLEISPITPAILALLPIRTAPFPSPSLPKKQSRQLPIFPSRSRLEALPSELLPLITAHLTTKSILALHRTSQTLAASIFLNQTFWRDQLIHGCVVPYIWPGDLDAEACRSCDSSGNRDWEALVRTLMQPPHLLSNAGGDNWPDEPWVRTLPIGLQNRRRVWAIAAGA